MLLELLRAYTMVLLSMTAASYSLPLLSALPPKLDELVAAAAVPPSTSAIWADVKVHILRIPYALYLVPCTLYLVPVAGRGVPYTWYLVPCT